MRIQCEDCKYASWDMEFFPDGPEIEIMGIIKPAYTEQFDVYCSKHNKFLMEQEIGGCEDSIYGPNNYSKVCDEYYKRRKEYLEHLRSLQEFIEKNIIEEI